MRIAKFQVHDEFLADVLRLIPKETEIVETKKLDKGITEYTVIHKDLPDIAEGAAIPLVSPVIRTVSINSFSPYGLDEPKQTRRYEWDWNLK